MFQGFQTKHWWEWDSLARVLGAWQYVSWSQWVCVCLSPHSGMRVAQWKEECGQMGSGVLSEGKSHLCLSCVCEFEKVCGYAKARISANVLLCSFTFMNMYARVQLNWNRVVCIRMCQPLCMHVQVFTCLWAFSLAVCKRKVLIESLRPSLVWTSLAKQEHSSTQPHLCDPITTSPISSNLVSTTATN